MVIGGAFGIGLATARRFAAEGANVVIADLDDEQAAVLDLAGPDAVLLGTPAADSSHWVVAILREVSGGSPVPGRCAAGRSASGRAGIAWPAPRGGG